MENKGFALILILLGVYALYLAITDRVQLTIQALRYVFGSAYAHRDDADRFSDGDIDNGEYYDALPDDEETPNTLPVGTGTGENPAPVQV